MLMSDHSPASIESAIHDYLALFKDKPDEDGVRLSRLCEALDRLVIEYHRSPEVQPGTEDEAPSVPYEPLAARASASFPELGLYAHAEPMEGLDQQLTQGDAIDDLADIARDLSGVLWLIKHGAVDDAIWEFRFGYQSHWGMHLHQLRRYLYSVMH